MVSRATRGTALAGAVLVAMLAGAVLAAGSSRTHRAQKAAAASTAAAPAITTADASSELPPDLSAAFPALVTAPRVIDARQLAVLANLRAELHAHRPDLQLGDPVGWLLGSAGDAEYAVVSLGPERVCLVGFRPGGQTTSGPACAAPAVAESPASPLAIYGTLEPGKGGIAVLVPAGTRAIALRTEHERLRARRSRTAWRTRPPRRRQRR